MSRLIDRIYKNGFTPTIWQKASMLEREWQELTNNLHVELKNTEIIVADNVAEYLYAGTDQEEWNIKQDFPCLAPSFPLMFIEWRCPSLIRSRELGILERGRTSSRWPYASGVALAATPRDDMRPPDAKVLEQELHLLLLRNEQTIARKFQEYGRGFIEHLTPDEKRTLNVGRTLQAVQEKRQMEPPEGVKWALQAVVFVELEKKDGPIIVPSQWELLVGSRGEVREEQWGLIGGRHDIDKGELQEYLQIAAGTSTHMFPAFLALSFMHCKNVKLITNDPPSKLNKAYQKRRGRPLVRYHTLEIEPMKQVLRREGQIEKLGLKKALHICRGHFKDYTERGLFGKYKGLYWWDHHVRGDLKEGAVVKDYAVKI